VAVFFLGHGVDKSSLLWKCWLHIAVLSDVVVCSTSKCS